MRRRNTALPTWPTRALGGVIVGLCLVTAAFAQSAFSGLDPAPVTASPRTIDIPGTAFQLRPPAGWRTQSPPTGAALSVANPNGTAQIIVNLMQPENGLSMARFQDAISANIGQSLIASGFVAAPGDQPQRRSDHGIERQIFHYTLSDPAGDLEQILLYAVIEPHLAVLNATVLAGQSDALQETLASLRSLRRTARPAHPPTPRTTASRAPTNPAGNAFAGLDPAPARPVATPPATSANARTEALPGEDGRPPQRDPTAVSATASRDDPPARERVLMRTLAEHYREDTARELAALRFELAVDALGVPDHARAFAYLDSAVALAPDEPAYLELLADVLDFIAEPAAPYLAQSYYEDALALAPDTRRVRIKLAASYLATGDLHDARHHYETLTENPGAEPDPHYLTELAIIYLTLNDAHSGAEFIATLVERGAGPRFALTLAILLNQLDLASQAQGFATVAARQASDPELKRYASALARKYGEARHAD